MASKDIPYMVGNCDFEMGCLLSAVSMGLKNDSDRETILKVIAATILKMGIPAEQANKVANDSLTAMEKVYGSDPNCPFKEGDLQFSRYCYVRASADQAQIQNNFTY